MRGCRSITENAVRSTRSATTRSGLEKCRRRKELTTKNATEVVLESVDGVEIEKKEKKKKKRVMNPRKRSDNVTVC